MDKISRLDGEPQSSNEWIDGKEVLDVTTDRAERKSTVACSRDEFG